MRIAIIHDWLTGMRGGEAILEAILELFPTAEIFTLLHKKGSVSPLIESKKIHTSFLHSIPGIENNYRYFLPLMPLAVSTLNVKDFDLILSSSHCVAKGVQKAANAKHIAYIHAPMRYVWDRFEDYFGPSRSGLSTRLAAQMVRPYLQNWDQKTSAPNSIDLVLANSSFIARQIENNWNRKATVVYPFVEYDRFQKPRQVNDYYLMVGAFAPNKRTHLAIEAFNKLGYPLKIIGSGQEEAKLKSIAKNNIEFLGSVPRTEITRAYLECKAFIFPGVEDFGITPLEAMASGAPVVAFLEGGVLETVTPDTGVFFNNPTSESLSEAVQKIETSKVSFSEKTIRERASHFQKSRFIRDYQAAVLPYL